MKRVYKDGYSYFNPPEKDEPEYIEFQDTIVIPLDATILIDNQGSWEYEDYDWAESEDREYWWSESEYYPSIQLCDSMSAVEYTDQLLESMLPFASGRYHITGEVNLTFKIENIEKYSDYVGTGYHDEEVIDEEYVTDFADVEFVYDDSSIENFEIEQLK